MSVSIPTRDTRIVAALAALGVPNRIEVIYDEKSSTSIATYHLDLGSAIPGMQHVRTSAIRLGLKDKTLSDVDPVLDCLRAMHNRKLLLAMLKCDERIVLVSTAAGRRMVYAKGGGGLPGVSNRGDLFRTNDLLVVSAMAVVGIPVLAVDGSSDRYVFTLPILGEWVDGMRYSGGEILRDYRDGTLATKTPEHPFLYAMAALKHYRTILKEVNKQVELVLLRKPNSKKAAYVRADASDKAYDTVKKHFGA